jgi:hypothetical protein
VAIYAVAQEGKHSFLRDMSNNVTRGMLAKAKAGEWGLRTSLITTSGLCLLPSTCG